MESDECRTNGQWKEDKSWKKALGVFDPCLWGVGERRRKKKTLVLIEKANTENRKVAFICFLGAELD